MATFRVYREKRYETEVTATTASEAQLLAQDLPGKAWRLTGDAVLQDVVGLDGAKQHLSDN